MRLGAIVGAGLPVESGANAVRRGDGNSRLICAELASTPRMATA